MKKIIIILILFVCNPYNLQAQFLFDVNRAIANTLFLSNNLNNEVIEGSPYASAEFKSAKVSGTEEKCKLRYNSYDDVFEIQNENSKVFNINKSEPFSTIIFETTFDTYRLVTFKDKEVDKYGYLFEIFNSEKLKVLKREKSIFIKAQPLRSSYDLGKPAKFAQAPTEFYWNLNSESYVLFPTSKKKLLELFPTKKNEINQFFKNFSPNFKDDKSIASIADFCSRF